MVTKIDRKIHYIDAQDKILGRLATQIAILLRGKNKSSYTPNIDNGDIVQVVNVSKLKFTPEKKEQKFYYHFSGYPGGMKATSLEKMLKTHPERVLENAVRQMLPGNKTRQKMMQRLIIIKEK